jgi:hypothetical protein
MTSLDFADLPIWETFATEIVLKNAEFVPAAQRARFFFRYFKEKWLGNMAASMSGFICENVQSSVSSREENLCVPMPKRR